MKTKLTKREQETIIVWNEADDTVSISTYNKDLANKFLKAGIKPTRAEVWNTNTWGYEFEINKESLFVGLRKRQNLSDEERARRAENMRSIRKES